MMLRLVILTCKTVCLRLVHVSPPGADYLVRIECTSVGGESISTGRKYKHGGIDLLALDGDIGQAEHQGSVQRTGPC